MSHSCAQRRRYSQEVPRLAAHRQAACRRNAWSALTPGSLHTGVANPLLARWIIEYHSVMDPAFALSVINPEVGVLKLSAPDHHRTVFL